MNTNPANDLLNDLWADRQRLEDDQQAADLARQYTPNHGWFHARDVMPLAVILIALGIAVACGLPVLAWVLRIIG